MKESCMFNLKSFRNKSRALFYLFIIALLIATMIIWYINIPIKCFQKKEISLFKMEPKGLTIDANTFCDSGLCNEVFFPDFSNKLQVWFHEPRPDEENKEKYLEVMLLSDNKSKIILSGDKLYLLFDQGYKFSEKPTNFWLLFIYQYPNVVRVTMKARYMETDETIVTKEEHFELIVLEHDYKMLSMSEDNAFLSLNKAICLGPDLFLDICEKEKEHSQLQRLIFPSNETCYVKSGDLLIYKDSRWQLQDNLDTKGYPLARINSFNVSGLDIDFWGKSEKIKRKIVLQKPSKGTTLHVSDDFISELNIRTKKQVSCKIQGQRIIINENDLLFKKKGIWKKGSLSDFESQEEASEFFIFEKLDFVAKEKSFVGYVFNGDKTQVVKIEKAITKKISNQQPNKVINSQQNRKRR